jgi:uncharacterized protein (DUF58 family)
VKRAAGTLAAAAVLAAAAESLASIALFVVAIGLSLLVAGAGIAVGVAARRITVTRAVRIREVPENVPIRLRFTVGGISWLPVALEIEDPEGRWAAIAGDDAEREVCVSRRGAFWLAPSRLRLRDAFGIFEWRLLAGRAEPLLILPTPAEPVRLAAGQLTGADDLEPHGLAPYVPGTPLARIYWPALARGAGLHVRQFAPPPGGLPLIVVDTTAAANSQALDWTARTAAGYILALARGRGCRVLLPGDGRETSLTGAAGDWPAMHRRLAMLGHSTAGTQRRPVAAPGILYVRAATAPSGLTPPPPLPVGVLPRSS